MLGSRGEEYCSIVDMYIELNLLLKENGCQLLDENTVLQQMICRTEEAALR